MHLHHYFDFIGIPEDNPQTPYNLGAIAGTDFDSEFGSK